MKSRFANEYWINSGFFTILKNISSLILAFGGFYFLVRMLDKNSFGGWCLFLSTTTLLEFSRNGLVSNAFLKFLASADKEDYPKIVTASFTVTGILTLLGIIVNCCIARWLSHLWNMPEIENMFYLYNVVFVITGITNLFSCIQQANMKFKGVFQTAFAGSAINFVYIAAVYYWKMPVSLMALVYVQVVGGVIGIFIAYKHTRPLLQAVRNVDRKWVKTILSYGKFSFGTILSAMIFNSIDQWMLGYMLLPAAAAAYNIAIRITNIVEVPTGTIAAIVFPQSSRRSALEGDSAAKYLYEKSVGVILALLVPALLILYLFPEMVVRFIAGNKYAESVDILRVTVFFCVFIPFGRQFGTIMDSIGRPKVNFFIVLISALVNIGLNFIFIRQAGIIGAAYGTLCASIFSFVIYQGVLRKQLGVNVLNTLKYAWGFYPEMIRKYLRPAKKSSIAEVVE